MCKKPLNILFQNYQLSYTQLPYVHYHFWCVHRIVSLARYSAFERLALEKKTTSLRDVSVHNLSLWGLCFHWPSAHMCSEGWSMTNQKYFQCVGVSEMKSIRMEIWISLFKTWSIPLHTFSSFSVALVRWGEGGSTLDRRSYSVLWWSAFSGWTTAAAEIWHGSIIEATRQPHTTKVQSSAFLAW